LSLFFVFPGQGSQYVGMGKNLYENFAEAKETFDLANEILNFDLAKLCFEGPENELNLTNNTQPALLTTSVATLAVLKAQGYNPQAAAGHSLGEYTALVCAGAMSFADAVRLVRLRGQYMQEAAAEATGGMAAILGLDSAAVADVCAQVSATGHRVDAVNYNCPGQVVIAGTQNGLQRAMDLAKEAGARRCIPLAVSGPFHSSLMQPAGEKLADALAGVTIHNPQIPVLSNVTADYIENPVEIKTKLVEQVYSPVRWEEIVQRMAKDGCTQALEVGPGKVLSGLIKKTNKEIKTFNVEDKETLEKVLAQLKEVG
jgi:[acyl-carrier-protein] S-malonyltransferase